MKGKIIVVDRNVAFAEKMAKVLEEEKYNVFPLGSGKQVLEILHTVGIHVVICGNLAPGISSLELLKAIKTTNRETEVILMSDMPTIGLLEGAIKGEASDFIRLPVQEWSALKQIVSEAFDKSQEAFKNNRLIEDLLKKNQELLEAHHTISTLHQDTEALYYFGRCLATSLDLEEIYAMMTNATNKLLSARPTLLLLFDEIESRLYLKKAIGVSDPPEDLTIPIDRTYHNNVSDYIEEGAYLEYLKTMLPGISDRHSFLVKPILIHDKLYGALIVIQSKDFECTEREINLFKQFVSQSAFVLENALLHEKANELANYDGLTGVFNRRYFQEKIEEEIKRAERQNGKFSLIVLDIDYFKYFNDRYGHIQGDILLKRVVAVMMERLRSTDVVCRFGGDEFVILLIDTEKKDACEIASQIRETIENSPGFAMKEGDEKQLTVSMGVSEYPGDGSTVVDLVRTADQALYVAKAKGRNQVAC
ncbi:MAG: diguanylate cyclase [Nitrospirae bacterium]|nr:diguanylate cyclase [Nitrospirota bacterium]